MKTHNPAITPSASLAPSAREGRSDLARRPEGTKGVSDVLVKLVPPAGKEVQVDRAYPKEAVIDQPHCAFVPHVQVR